MAARKGRPAWVVVRLGVDGWQQPEISAGWLSPGDGGEPAGVNSAHVKMAAEGMQRLVGLPQRREAVLVDAGDLVEVDADVAVAAPDLVFDESLEQRGGGAVEVSGRVRDDVVVVGRDGQRQRLAGPVIT